PTAALDSHTGRNVMELMKRLAHQDGRAVIIVTHDPRMVEFADRVTHIEDGLISAAADALPPVGQGILTHNYPKAAGLNLA
ncbi:MAG TPA: hypothetical protein VJV74_09795, partial [Terriglobia bacterium]|nr:hypothetical protein [Terriglobia bacterium]